ncbi:MAG: DNA translocase FtsK [Clostridia bacterium]|nr:DNA translocase FtsK [Clostridia bacterium]
MVLFSLSVVRIAKWFARRGRWVSSWVSDVQARFRAERREQEREEKRRIRAQEEQKLIAQVGDSDVDDEDEEPREIEFISSADKHRDRVADDEDEDEDVEFDDSDEDDEDEIIPGVVDGENRLPDPGSVIPTKIPDPRTELTLVTAKEEFDYIKPPFSMLHQVEEPVDRLDEQRLQAQQTALKLEAVMRSFGIEAKVISISRGSTVTMYELQPQSGVKVSRIKNLADDIALNLAASGIRIEAPIPGKAAIGIEIPNEEKSTVYLKSLVETNAFLNHKSKLAFCLGEDISGDPVIADIAKMPHMLIAGTTGSGKSVCVNCLIVSLLYRCSPNDVRLIMIDPKVVELQMYNGIPHLLVPVVTEPKKAAAALSWAVQEMENRYKQFALCNIRDINAYNLYAKEHDLPTLPRIVIIIDELADLMMVVRDSIEEAINRIAQKARAAGMHLIVATQRPSVDVITGLIKANIPSRIAFAVSSQVDSKTILDYGGAEKLLGRGDMLYYPVGNMKATRVQGGFVSDGEIENIVEFIKDSVSEPAYDDSVSAQIDSVRILEKGGKRSGGSMASGGGVEGDGDPLLSDALDIAIEVKQISASFLQRKLGLGYARASRLIDQLEERGYISGRDGNNPRHVLVQENPMRND